MAGSADGTEGRVARDHLRCLARRANEAHKRPAMTDGEEPVSAVDLAATRGYKTGYKVVALALPSSVIPNRIRWRLGVGVKPAYTFCLVRSG